MTNEQRRSVLAQARTRAAYWAEQAEEAYRLRTAGDDHTAECIALASMWATVANALKVGSDIADRADS